MTRNLLLPILILAALFGCSNRQEQVKIIRLDQIAQLNNTASIPDVFTPAFKVLALVYGLESSDSAAMAYLQSPALRTFAPDIAARLDITDTLERQLGEAFSYLTEALPCHKFPHVVYGIATPYNQSVVVSDTIVLLGLNHYLGPDYPGYASFQEYQRDQKTPRRIAPDITEAILAAYEPMTPADSPTALSRILYNGALLHTVHKALPDITESTVLGYTPQQMKWAIDNEANIWKTLAESDILFSTDPVIADRLLLPSPATTIINSAAPGRLGRFIGYRIVDSYVKNNPDATIAELLSPDFYQSAKTLRESGYSPL